MQIDEKNKYNFFSDRELHMNTVGLQIFDHEPYGIIREKGRLDFQLLLMKSGQCSVETEGKMYLLGENELICFYPGEKQKYFFLGDYSESYWIHFSGTKSRQILSKCGIKSGIYRVSNINEIHLTLEKMRRAFLSKVGFYELKCVGLLIELLSHLAEDINRNEGTHSLSDDLMDYLHNNYTNTISFDDFARENGISTHRLIQIFKAQTGFTPHKYKMQLKLIDAKRLLKNTDLFISEIARKVGFADPLYFSRVFKKYIGCSPREFKEKDENIETEFSRYK